jgi:hypothetical protein
MDPELTQDKAVWAPVDTQMPTWDVGKPACAGSGGQGLIFESPSHQAAQWKGQSPLFSRSEHLPWKVPARADRYVQAGVPSCLQRRLTRDS